MREILPDQKLHQYLKSETTSLSAGTENFAGENVQTVVFAGNQITAPKNEETWVKLSNVESIG